MPDCRLPSEQLPARLGPLARLPVFFSLAGRPVLVAGGTAAAAWKAELVAAAGAIVTVIAVQPGEEVARLATDGVIRLLVRSWDDSDLAGMALAVADLDGSEGEAFAAAARGRGVPVNIVDRPALCDFTFGSIVNRSPVVIGISTDGAAPILGQEIRRRIEAVLPAGLAGWSALAARIRGRIAARLPTSAGRRAFWRRFCERAFADPPPADGGSVVDALIAETAAAATSTGRVTLVGAGPGDAEHLTLKAVRALQAADVILFDDLVSPAVLELARREARRIAVGKRGHGPSCRQDDINARMVALARQGLAVARLKCGDPMVFGRAGEEIAALRRAGIPVDVVPGITAASAAASRLGVSLTHRGTARSVRFITGHDRSGRLPEDLDWRGLADPGTTLVVYMGARTAPDLARRLLHHGLAPDTPAAVLTSISQPAEQVRTTDLLGLATHGAAWDGPVLLVLGRVVAMADAIAPVAGLSRQCRTAGAWEGASATRNRWLVLPASEDGSAIRMSMP
ncbi:MAG: uroporphyrinogen-III C-methyltransferase [Rhodospirillaceae bacterium]|nr:uroporphyrinogen-III C-methyltransferase [Rhodospirillaceae bacterium]